MEPQRIDQTEFGEHGNCQSACLAMILGLQLEEVPNFSLAGDDDACFKAQDDWLAERGWALHNIVKWRRLPWPPPRGFYIAGGQSHQEVDVLDLGDGREEVPDLGRVERPVLRGILDPPRA